MSTEHNQAYGSLREGVHIAGYSLERAWQKLEWLLEGDGWKSVGDGFTDVNTFMDTIKLDGFRMIAEQRKRIVSRIKALQPEVSNRTIANTLGVHHDTVNRDVGGNPPKTEKSSSKNNEPNIAAGGFPPAPEPSGAEAAAIVNNKQQSNERKQAKEEKRQELLNAEFSALGPFDVVVIDPPWPMQKIDRDVRPNQAEFAYDTMTVDEIATFWHDQIEEHVAERCHLFCWTTQKFLPATFDIIRQWGFSYVLTMVWHKPGGIQPIGLPQYNCEFVVYARRAAPMFVDTKKFNVCNDWPRREHSRKPAAFYELVARVTGGSRLDVFAREAHDGFAQYGKEIAKFDSGDE